MDSANILFNMGNGLLSSNNTNGPFLAMAIHGGFHQPLPLLKGGRGGEKDGRCKRPTGWASWDEGVGMNSSSCREEEQEGRKGKKIKRLTAQQVRALEASFEEEKKLEPERKQELALQLGLQSRQVAVWFQNRRARSKSKQLELDFAHLSSRYRSLLAETHRLKAQVARLTKELNTGETRAYEVTLKSTINGIFVKEDMFEGVTSKNDTLGVLIKDKANVANLTKECPSPCSSYSVIVDCESPTSIGHRNASVYECNNLNHLDYSCLSHGWNEDSLLAMHGLNPSSYNNLQSEDLRLDELPLTNAMIYTTADHWLRESTI